LISKVEKLCKDRVQFNLNRKWSIIS